MKMKKFFLLFSMIAVLGALTACSSGTQEVSFEYSDEDIVYSTVYQAYQIDNIDDAYRAYLEDQKEDNPMAEVLLTGVANFDSAKDDCGKFVGYVMHDGSTKQFDFAGLSAALSNAQSQEEYDAAQSQLDNFVKDIDYVIEEDNNGNVIVNIKAAYERRNADYSFVYEENPEAAYSYALTGQNAATYKIKEITVTPDYSMGEIMGKAAANTLMGMGTVFAVLIFISIIIGQFGKINSVVTKMANAKANKDLENSEVVETSGNSAVVTASDNIVANDSELVAVITAAVVAANVANGGSDNLIVRSIRKARR